MMAASPGGVSGRALRDRRRLLGDLGREQLLGRTRR